VASKWFRSVELEGWNEFKSLIGELIDDAHDLGRIGDFWFRGQGDSTYRLESSLDRRHPGLSIPGRIALQDLILAAFSERAVSVEKELREDPDWCLSILQHYGSPTRLLDWSASPYVGAYFSFTSPPAHGEEISELASVWMLSIAAEHWRANTGLRMIKPRFDNNQRALHQHGYFTLNESLSPSIESYLATYYAGSPDPVRPALLRIDMPRSDASVALRDLALMGVSSESLFPEFTGLARHSYFKALDASGLLE
jgi:FRG domain